MTFRHRVGVCFLQLQEALLAWMRAHSRTRARLPEHLRTGIAGEDAAWFYLRRNGYLLVARRWKDRESPGDLDLVGWHNGVLCFIEVKTRTARDAFPAEGMVDHEKRAILRRLARAYLRRFPESRRPECRFDVLSVYLLDAKRREFEILASAFGWSEAGTSSHTDRW